MKEIRRIIDEKVDPFRGEMIKVEWVGQKMPSWLRLKDVQRRKIANLLAEFKNKQDELKKEQKERKRRLCQRNRNTKKIEEIFKHKDNNGEITYKVFLEEDDEEDFVKEKQLKDEMLLKYWKKRHDHPPLIVFLGEDEEEDWVEEKHLKDEVLLKYWKKRRNHLLDICQGVLEDDDEEEEIDEEQSDQWSYWKGLSIRAREILRWMINLKPENMKTNQCKLQCMEERSDSLIEEIDLRKSGFDSPSSCLLDFIVPMSSCLFYVYVFDVDDDCNLLLYL